ncbi:MAG: copper chaperone PCu(A)C [Anaerolineae bacterium]|nr:copper chaperone PCu(A)C [Anaerolineae bacterium]
MSRSVWVVLCAGLLVMVGAAAAQSQADAIVVYNIWARPTAAGEGGMSGMGDMNDMEGMGGMEEMQSEDSAMHAGAASTIPSAAYFVIENRGETPVVLASVTTPVAGRAEIHRTVIENSVASMVPVETGIEIGPGETFSFDPGGYHVMLLDLVQDLKAGDYFALTLNFDMPGAEAMTHAVTVGAMVQDLPYETAGVIAWVESVTYDEMTPETASATLIVEYPEADTPRLVNVVHMGIGLPTEIEDGESSSRATIDLAPMFDMMYVPETLALPITLVLDDGTSFDMALPFAQASEMMMMGEHDG